MKHHLGFIKEFTAIKPTNWRTDLLELGNLHFDIYTGKLTISSIYDQLITMLQDANVSNEQSYFSFLGDQLSYKQLTISDCSNWILRWGNAPPQFIHIHPARFGEHIYRVRATALKTVIAMNILGNNINEVDLEVINSTRINLGISPITNNGMRSVMELMCLLKDY
ncbi:hypothetical protein NF867_08640 [Solitalea sp. MAHUQ-68]|uniref:Uncharacterized protein n=1 Tax=Solitalea agri TaxID=2953739 RepID=A0A9X2F2B9_9SPHI|nr:hypothetical protein [Solitalea agri]MCO4292926.1 hypothetical protein [Solitalea agri]